MQISIIVPCFNSEQTLERCIISILEQTYRNFELILINDGSTDNTGSIIQSFLYDSRIRYIKKEKNGGLSAARNMGLDHVRGDYVVFIDSDDWVEKNYLENLSKGLGVDLCSNYYIAHNLNGWRSLPFDNKVYRSDIADFLSTNIRKLVFPFCKLYRYDLIKNHKIYFDSDVYAEDTLFTFTYLSHVKSIQTQSDALYHYDCSKTDSLSKVYVSWEKLSNTIDKIVSSIKSIEESFDCNLQEAISHFSWQYARKYIINLQKNGSIKEIRNGLIEIVKNDNVKNNLKQKSTGKSILRHCFDYLLCKRYYLIASIIVKVEYILLSRGLIHRS